uniref:Equilibrative nucleoside transporter 1 n=1 Tax=Oncorhynchus tshawytscha TaxID=74940 RepID=A0A8C8CJ64_ONCTS
MDVHKPEDKNNGVWLIFFMLGLGTLLPWSFFMTATMYFTSRLRDPTQISTDKPYDRSPTEASYNNVSPLCATVPVLIFTCLNSVLHHRIPQKFRIMGSLAVILVLFLITAIAVKIDMAAGPFFTLTMIKIVIINSFGAILQGSLFGMAGLLPAKYTTPIMSGQGLAGTFAAFSMICAIASGSALNDVAFGYFLTACVVIILAIMSYAILPKLVINSGFEMIMKAMYWIASFLLPPENAATTTPVLKQGEEEQTVSMLTIFKKIWVLALSVCFAFTVTIGVYPAVTVDVKSTVANGGAWEMYFIPVCCFLLFNLSDWAGRSLTAVCTWPGKDSKLVPIFMVARVIFVPLFMLCNVQPRYNLPVVFPHDAWFIVFMLLFAFSSGYLASLCMCFGPKLVAPHEAETAGAIMAFFLSLGLALGASFSFLFRAIV